MMRTLSGLLLILCSLFPSSVAAQTSALPRLERQQGAWQLTVDGEPFLMLCGELHNSSTGSAHYMAPIWPLMAAKKLNTVLAAVSWELVEPREGEFHFELVDSIILGARTQGLRVGLLWFGAWKNGTSTYSPSWVKRNPKRFPLACFKDGEPTNTLSALGKNTLEADKRAFCRLMEHIKEVDGIQHTVIAVQIENEVGTLDAASAWGGWPNRAMRDFSTLADKAFAGPVPQTLIGYLKAHHRELHPTLRQAWERNRCRERGTWQELFADSVESCRFLAEELFNTWNYATYIGTLAREAKAIYPLPLFVNAWIKGDFGEPGKYPSGGPQPHTLDLWHAAAPDVDLLCPDLYATHLFDEVMQGYDTPQNPVLVPETRCQSDGAARAFYAFGRYQTLGYSPFGIDGGGLMNSAVPQDHAYDKAYALLSHLTPYIIKHRRSHTIGGLLLDGDSRQEDRLTMGRYTVAIRPYSTEKAQALVGVVGEEVKLTGQNVAGLIVMQETEDQFLVAGGIGNLMVCVWPATEGRRVAFDYVDEITFTSDGRELLHRLNGDETTLGGPVIRDGEVKAFRIKMYEY